MRDLDTSQEGVVAGPVTEPQYLVSLELDMPLFFSTFSTRDFDGQTYNRGEIRLGKVTPREAEVLVWNQDDVWTDGSLTGSFQRSPVKIHWAYSDTDPILLFDGIINNTTPQNDGWLRVQCTRTSPKLYPGTRIRPPLANHLPAVGYSIQFDGVTITVERANSNAST